MNTHNTTSLDLSFLNPDAAEPFNTAEALARMNAADALVERLGVPGTDAVIQAAAVRCVEAHARRDMTGIRKACVEVEQRAGYLKARAANRGTTPWLVNAT